MFTFLMSALATAYRWQRQLRGQTCDEVIVFMQGWYGTFPIAEFALLVNVKLKDVAPGIGTPQKVLANYALTTHG